MSREYCALAGSTYEEKLKPNCDRYMFWDSRDIPYGTSK